MRLMIKKIILFTKGIETLWYFSEQLGKELRFWDMMYFTLTSAKNTGA